MLPKSLFSTIELEIFQFSTFLNDFRPGLRYIEFRHRV